MNFEVIAGIIILSSIFGYLLIINFIYFLSPNKKWNEFPKRCSNSTKCTRVADVNTRGHGLKPISTNFIPEAAIALRYSFTRSFEKSQLL